ncbi:hypothetical protein HAX54_051451, partial [Datura stramonium]|nr:hypothetical protein [Datura stramonium]
RLVDCHGRSTAADDCQEESLKVPYFKTYSDDEVPLNLVFSIKPCSSSKSSSKSQQGIKRGPVTRGKVKRSMEEILKDNHQNTLKRHRLLRATVFEDEVPSSQLVKIDDEETSQTIEKSLMVGKESRRRKKVKPKGTKVAMAEETAEGPGAAYQGSKQKTIIPQSLKGKKMTGRGPSVSMNPPPLDDHLDERIGNH